jgi:hypothetical protein
MKNLINNSHVLQHSSQLLPIYKQVTELLVSRDSCLHYFYITLTEHILCVYAHLYVKA